VQVVQAGGGNHSLSHAVDIYRGANNASIRRSNHNQLDVHGLGKEFRWVSWLHHLLIAARRFTFSLGK